MDELLLVYHVGTSLMSLFGVHLRLLGADS